MIDVTLAIFAFTAGLVSFLNPCGFAMLPAYITMYLNKGDDTGGRAKRVIRGGTFGLILTAGFTSTFAIIGLALVVLGSILQVFLIYLTMAIGLVLIIIGLMMWGGRKKFSLNQVPFLDKIRIKDLSPKSVFTYGVAFGIASVGCTLPIFSSVVVFSLVSGDIVNGVLNFFTYSSGMGVAMLVFSVALALSKEGVMGFMKKILPHMGKINGIVLIAAGLYLNYYHLHYNFGLI